MRRALINAVNRAEATCAHEYHTIDPELTNVLIAQTRRIDSAEIHSRSDCCEQDPFDEIFLPSSTVCNMIL